MTIKKTLTVAWLIAIIFCSISIGMIYMVHLSGNIVEKERITRKNSLLLANELRESSQSLTNAVRSFTATGDEKHVEIYHTILAIRSGALPRPADSLIAPNEKIALIELMKKSGFTTDELNLLQKSTTLSDVLTTHELKAIYAMRGLYPDDAGEYTITGDVDKDLAQSFVFGTLYDNETCKIMTPITEFETMLNKRLDFIVLSAEKNYTMFVNILKLNIILFTALFIGFLIIVNKLIIRPILDCDLFAEKIASGQLDSTLDYKNNNEIGLLADALRNMSHSLQERIFLLHKSQERIQMMLDVTPLSISFLDKNLEPLDCNLEAVRLFKLTNKKEFLEKFFMLFPKHQPDGTLSKKQALQTIKIAFKEGYCRFEWTHQALDGEPIPTEVTLIKTNYNGEEAIVTFIRDLREQKSMLAKLNAKQEDLKAALTLAEEASKAKNIFFANISHEIRTPMNAILGMSYLCLQDSTDERTRYYLENIQTAGKNLLEIINNVLELSKIEVGKLEFESIPFNLIEILENLSATLCSLITDKPIEILFDIEPTLPTQFIGDRTRLMQVLTNLFSNAIKFTEKGHLLLHVYLKNRQKNLCTLGIDVSDTGIGMSKDRLEAIFRPFEQEDQTIRAVLAEQALGSPFLKV